MTTCLNTPSIGVSAPLMGAHFRPPAKTLLAILPANFPLTIRPEPENPYDSNALAVWLDVEDFSDELWQDLLPMLPGSGFDETDLRAQRHFHIGYAAKEIAATTQKAVIELLRENALDALPARLGFSGVGKYQISF